MVSEVDIDQSYKTIEWMTLSLKKIAVDPKLLGTFLYDYTQNLPDILDAVMSITKAEHRGVVADLLKASGEMSVEVLKYQTRK